eukprot:TRINITY_DN515_c0_g1_i1.p1 TRINITY_DN515_c0_g1~~TRINITY_DN515_c0_g1_i1.p1  ORF type:complete len:219 (+),score=69.71 TRINITY_DN515_c0_g1_i1:68-724(+)
MAQLSTCFLFVLFASLFRLPAEAAKGRVKFSSWQRPHKDAELVSIRQHAVLAEEPAAKAANKTALAANKTAPAATQNATAGTEAKPAEKRSLRASQKPAEDPLPPHPHAPTQAHTEQAPMASYRTATHYNAEVAQQNAALANAHLEHAMDSLEHAQKGAEIIGDVSHKIEGHAKTIEHLYKPDEVPTTTPLTVKVPSAAHRSSVLVGAMVMFGATFVL